MKETDDPFDDPLWQRAEAAAAKRNKPDERFIGCPLWWFKRVLPVVQGKSELAVALAAYRLQAALRSRTVAVSNVYLARLGIDRFAKYRAFDRLEAAGLIVIRRRNKQTLEIEFRQNRSKRNAKTRRSR
jgi:hypothetical protein